MNKTSPSHPRHNTDIVVLFLFLGLYFSPSFHFPPALVVVRVGFSKLLVCL
jgi:hypothetical protein